MDHHGSVSSGGVILIGASIFANEQLARSSAENAEAEWY